MKVNPVLERELRERVRSRGAVVVLTIYLAVVVALFYLVYRGFVAASNSAFNGPYGATPDPGTGGLRATDAARVGRGVFEWLLFAALGLVLFIVPGYTSAAIAGERERQTLIPMQLTLLRPWQIAAGKVGASTAFVGLLLVATLPVLAVASAFGGVGLAEVVRALLAIIVVGLVLASVTVACSAVVRRVQAATVLAYACTLLLLFGTLVGYGTAQALIEIRRPAGTSSNGERAPAILVALNPVIFTGAAIEGLDLSKPIDTNSAIGRSTSPFTLTRLLMRPQLRSSGPVQDTGFGYFLPMSLVAMAGLALLSIRLAAGRLRVPREIER